MFNCYIYAQRKVLSYADVNSSHSENAATENAAASAAADDAAGAQNVPEPASMDTFSSI